MSLETSISTAAPAVQSATATSRHSALVRVTHWIITLCFLALLVSGMEIVISHPRFYWGESGTVNDKAWLQLPIPSSRNLVQTGYSYVMPDQNGWSRYLHFQAAWLAVFTALLYGIYGVLSGHFRKNLLPGTRDLSWRTLCSSLGKHLRFARPGPEEARSYNTLQRLSYLSVIFVLFPLEIWTGLAMSPSFAGAFPISVILLGGRQSARTIHFLVSLALVLFVVVHVVMVCVSGFRSRMRGMITGRGDVDLEQS